MPALLATFSWKVCSAVLPWLDELHVDAVFVQFGLKGRDLLVRFVDDVRQVVRERAHLIGDRVGDQHADPGERQEESEVHGQHRQPAGKAPALEKGDGRVEDQRDEPRDDEDQQHLPAAFASAHSASSAEREQRPAGPSAGRPRAGGSAGGAGRLGLVGEGSLLLTVGGASRGAFSGPSVTCLPPSPEYG